MFVINKLRRIFGNKQENTKKYRNVLKSTEKYRKIQKLQKN